MHLREYDVTFNYCISGHFKIKKNLTVMEKKINKLQMSHKYSRFSSKRRFVCLILSNVI